MASYEADFLLKNRDKTKAVKKSYEVMQFNEKAVYLALLTDVATVYTNILQYDDLIEKQAEILKNQEEILQRSNKKYERGVISLTELNGSKKSVETSKSLLEKLQKDRETAMMQLAVLTGNSSSNISEMKVGDFDSFEYAGVIPDEISSDVIFSRPDVKMAEANLEKAAAEVERTLALKDDAESKFERQAPLAQDNTISKQDYDTLLNTKNKSKADYDAAIAQKNFAKKYKGQVGYISPVAEFTPKTVQSTDIRTNLVYRIRVYIYDIDEYLRQGMPVTIKVNLTVRERLAIRNVARISCDATPAHASESSE